jgi:2-polyprenyl-3-methyl-5-hydroxy-6-metoxy-1,4-benzoquinol methylase
MSTLEVSPTGGAAVNAWPENGTEPVRACPVCGSEAREMVHRGLQDKIFRCAPGNWDLYRCGTCGTGYLDPRPNRATIALAYSRYCTHQSAQGVEQPPRSAWRRFRTAQRNAYLNATYGYHFSPAGRVPLWLTTNRRQRFDKRIGYLPYPGKGARVLDVGCGNGCFLMQMRAAGWEVSGVEPDPIAAAAAAAAGINVRTGLLEPGTQPEKYYDAVTLNHVIEHLHYPVETLRTCRQVLKPGGMIFIATPNFASTGHRLFGRDYFPLDPPRHLVLFTAGSLQAALRTAGFEPEPSVRLRLVGREWFEGSALIRKGSDPMQKEPPLSLPEKLEAVWRAWRADRATRSKPELTEELVLLGRRPIEA